MNIQIKEMEYSNELQQEFLKDMLYDAIFVPEGSPRPNREILELPQIKKYYKDFGTKSDDICYIAFDMDTYKMLGVIWARKFAKEKAGYGFVDENTPEIAIALPKKMRGMGIGARLCNHLIENMPKHIKQLSLSVDTQNRAYELYKNIGFRDVSVKNGTAVMLISIN